MDIVTVWGSREEIAKRLVGLRGTKITDCGFDVYDTKQEVTELTFKGIDVHDIFVKISDPETDLGGIANGVGISTKERR